MEGFPILSVIAYLPIVGLLAILISPRMRDDAVRWTALGVSLATLVLALGLLLGDATTTAALQFEENISWLPEVGINYHFGVDGLSILLVILTTLLTPIAIAISWEAIATRTGPGTTKLAGAASRERVREFHIAILMLETGLIGAFISRDIFLFYVFFELSLIPMALLIGIWGGPKRAYAAIKFFIYTLLGSLLMLVAIVATYQRYFALTGERTLDVQKLANPPLAALGMNSLSQFYPLGFQYWVFAAFFIAFAIKLALWPLHTWLPDAYTEAPTGGTVMLAGIMLKLGSYGLLRFCLPLYPDAARFFAPAIMVLSTITIVYAALVALAQTDWKRLLAYSSVSHIGFVTLAIFAFNQQALQGATMMMFAHGLNTAALFLLVGIIYERAGTRQIAAFRGLSSTMPSYAALFLVFTLASIGLPGLSGFVGEFNSLLGAYRGGTTLYQGAAVVSTVVIILSAWYMLWLYQRVAQGTPLTVTDFNARLAHGPGGTEADPHTPSLHPRHSQPEPPRAHGHDQHDDQGEPARATMRWADLRPRELSTLLPLLALTIVFGLYPAPLFALVAHALANILRPFDGGAAASGLGQ